MSLLNPTGRLFRGYIHHFRRGHKVKFMQTYQQKTHVFNERILYFAPTLMATIYNIDSNMNDSKQQQQIPDAVAPNGLITKEDSWLGSNGFIQQGSAAMLYSQNQVPATALYDYYNRCHSYKIQNDQSRSAADNWDHIQDIQGVGLHLCPSKDNKQGTVFQQQHETQEKLLPARFPVPPLHQTLDRYLQSIQPLTTTEEFECTKQMVEEFAKPGGVGERLQDGLYNKYNQEENWLYNWFIDANYLKVRQPFTIYTPGAIIPRQNFHGEEGQLQYAAKLIAGVLDFKTFIDTSQIPLEMQDGKPLCTDQYYKFFGACRVPGVEKDDIYPKDNNYDVPSAKHIVVACNNHFFSLDVYDTQGTPRSIDDLYHQLFKIKIDSQHPDIPLGVMTTEHRDSWGRVYTNLSQDPTNRQSFHAIHSSILVVCLDQLVPQQDNDFTDAARQSMYGAGSQFNSGNRWYDKVVQVFVGVDGYVGAAYERSRSEGIVRAKMLDHALTYARTEHTFSTISGSSTSSHIYRLHKLTFNIDEDSLSAIASAKRAVDKFSNDLQVSSFSFSSFGKGFIKSIGFSPDAFVQMAMQLTYFKLYGKSRATYETASLRKFHKGRTEIIRSVSNTSHMFVQAMHDTSKSQADMFNLMTTAIDSHKQYTTWAQNGNAIDRHLLGLKNMAQEYGEKIPDLFTDKSYTDSMDFKMVSSQVLLKNAFGMCYAPKVLDGYSICYNPKEDNVYFSITSFKSCQETDAGIFGSFLVESLHEMQTLAESVVSIDEETVAASI